MVFRSAVRIAVLLAGAAAPAQGQPVVLVADGKVELSIVTAAQAGEPEKFAAGELSRYLEKISAVKVPVLSQETFPQRAVCVGLLSSPAMKALVPDPPALKEDGFLLRAANGRVVCAGQNGRGVIYGVYALLERLGCHWLGPEELWEVVPSAETVSLGPVDVAESPTFPVRMAGHAGAPGVDWAVKTRFNEWAGLMDPKEAARRPLKANTPNHLAARVFMPAANFKDHPDWFTFDAKKGQRGDFGSFYCLTNPQATDQFAANVVAHCRKHPQIATISIWYPDGGNVCQCPECSKHSTTDNYFHAIARIAEAVKTAGLDVKVEALVAYMHTKTLPNERHALPDNVVLDAAYHSWHAGARASYLVRCPWTAWREAFPKNDLFLFEYYSDSMNNPWHTPYPRYIAEDVAAMRQHGAVGMVHCYYEFGRSPVGYLNHWLMGEMLWDGQADPAKLLLRWCQAAFGPDAGKPMAELLASFEVELEKLKDPPYPPLAGMVDRLALAREALAKAATEPQRQRLFALIHGDLIRHNPIFGRQIPRGRIALSDKAKAGLKPYSKFWHTWAPTEGLMCMAIDVSDSHYVDKWAYAEEGGPGHRPGQGGMGLGLFRRAGGGPQGRPVGLHRQGRPVRHRAAVGDGIGLFGGIGRRQGRGEMRLHRLYRPVRRRGPV